MVWIILVVYLVGVLMAGLLYILCEILRGGNKPSTYTELDWLGFYSVCLLSWVVFAGILLTLVYELLELAVKDNLPALKRLLIKVFG